MADKAEVTEGTSTGLPFGFHEVRHYHIIRSPFFPRIIQSGSLFQTNLRVGGQGLSRSSAERTSTIKQFLRSLKNAVKKRIYSETSLSQTRWYDPGKSPLDSGKQTVHSPEKRKASDQPAQPAKVQKFSINLGSKPAKPVSDKESANEEEKKPKAAPIKMSLSSQPKEVAPVLPKTKKVASIFNDEESDEEEEMPPEAKMRMKNVGRETPTSTGPNSFGKGRFGFCDRNSLFQKEMKKKMEEVCDD